MKYFLKVVSFVLLILMGIPQCWAAVQTDTHTCIVSNNEDAILIIDRKTGEERVFECPGIVDFAAQGSIGILCKAYSDEVIIISLQTAEEIARIEVGQCPKAVALKANWAYAANENSSTVSVIDLKTYKVLKHGDVGMNPNQLIVQGECLYVMTRNYINMFNRQNQLSNTVLKVVQWSKMAVYKDTLYVFNYASKNVRVLNFHTWRSEKTISFSHTVDSMLFSDETGYAFNHFGSISVLDLKRNIVKKEFIGGKYPQPSLNAVIDGQGYVLFRDKHKLATLDFESLQIGEKINNPNQLSVDCSDTHIYLGVTKLKPLPFISFKNPYAGIEGPLNGEAEEVFSSFQKACEAKKYAQSQQLFDQALALGHPKAYALASYAFLHGFWGAIDNDQDKWWLQFHQGADALF